MVRHVILWRLKETTENPEAVKANAKRELEALLNVIDGALKIEVKTDPLPTSDCDMMLDSAFESVEAYEGYRAHPLHVRAADTYIRPFTECRFCIDFEE